MLKFYIETVIIYFVIYIVTSIIFKKSFVKARDKLRKELNKNDKIYGYIKTTFMYLLISFIPVIRLTTLIGKLWLTFDTDNFISKAKEREDKDVHK